MSKWHKLWGWVYGILWVMEQEKSSKCLTSHYLAHQAHREEEVSSQAACFLEPERHGANLSPI